MCCCQHAGHTGYVHEGRRLSDIRRKTRLHDARPRPRPRPRANAAWSMPQCAVHTAYSVQLGTVTALAWCGAQVSTRTSACWTWASGSPKAPAPLTPRPSPISCMTHDA